MVCVKSVPRIKYSSNHLEPPSGGRQALKGRCQEMGEAAYVRNASPHPMKKVQRLHAYAVTAVRLTSILAVAVRSPWAAAVECIAAGIGARAIRNRNCFTAVVACGAGRIVSSTIRQGLVRRGEHGHCHQRNGQGSEHPRDQVERLLHRALFLGRRPHDLGVRQAISLGYPPLAPSSSGSTLPVIITAITRARSLSVQKTTCRLKKPG